MPLPGLHQHSEPTVEERLAALEARWQLPASAPAPTTSAAAAGPPSDPLAPRTRVSGQVQSDFVWFGQDANNRATVGDLEDGAAFRRARLVARGEAYEFIEYALGFDLALSGRPSLLDAYVELTDLAWLQNVRVGHFFEPFSLERMTANRNTTFLERSLADSFAPARNLGMMLHDAADNERGTWAIGGFRTGSDDFGDDVGDGEQAVTGRLTWLPYYDEACDGRRYFHVGAAYSFRDADEDAVRFRERPEVRLGALGEGDVPRFVDTGNVSARHHQLVGLEAAWVNGPLSVQGEFMLVPVDATVGADPTFHGCYAYASYFLTGEHRPYLKEFGTFDLVKPRANFSPRGGGPGAWELAARWSYLDLNDEAVLGGRLADTTLALNWHLTPNMRVMWEAIFARLADPARDRSNAEILGMRFDVAF